MEILNFAKKYYSDKKFNHACRVASYATSDYLLPQNIKYSLWKVALLHDIIEDTACTEEDLKKSNLLDELEYQAVVLLTHHKEDCSYEEYIIKLVESINPYVLPVKRADMKDHLMLADILTDKQKNKYYSTVKYIL